MAPACRSGFPFRASESGWPAALHAAIAENPACALEPLAGAGEANLRDRAYHEVPVPSPVKALAAPLPPELGEQLRQRLLELAKRP